MENQKGMVEIDKGKLVGKIEQLEKQINEQTKQTLSDRKIIEALNRERELMTKVTHKTQGLFVFTGNKVRPKN